MEESVTYQAILRQGKAIGKADGKVIGKALEARRLLFFLGRSRIGEPPARVVAALDAVSDVSQLEELAIRLLQVMGGAHGPVCRSPA